jgi:hypothetical protein
MSRTDVSDIDGYPSSDEPESMCSEGSHSIEADERGVYECVRCGFSLQSLVDWWGHDVEVGR